MLTPVRWPAPPGVRAVYSGRAGGFSAAPYDSLNLGDHVGDDPRRVARNRALYARALGVRAVFLNQVHGTQALELNPASPDGLAADAAVTRANGLACTIMVADCLPVLFTTRDGRCVAAAHAGWRGLLGQGGVGVLETCFALFCALAPVDQGQAATEVIAWLGPCIGPAAFEVGPEVRALWLAGSPAHAAFFRPAGGPGYVADLPGLARQRLAALGVRAVYGNDGSADWCTVSQPSRFFSHRRDRISGRQAVSIWRLP